MPHYRRPTYTYAPPDELQGGAARRYPVVVVGAGPIGLTAALDLARHGIETLLLDEDDTVSTGSRAICYAKRTLEIWDRLGVAEPMVDKGVTWNEGRVFFRNAELYRFSLRDEGDQKHPAFINLQQYYCEEILVEAALARPEVEIRWRNRVIGVREDGEGVSVEIASPDGSYHVHCDYLIAADGAKSAVRRCLGVAFEGQVFEDRFLIADVTMKAEFPNERWFWFDPPFNPGQSALLHMQPDNIWRIDLQLGRDADPEREQQQERVIPRIRRMLGPDTPFELEWTSVYTFQCRMLEKFRHGRVVFAGDSAHQVSPFGARGANSGVQDIDNLVWKLALVLRGAAPASLLDSYDVERVAAARENILNSTRSTEFITPKGAASRALRYATLHLARDWPFARALVNSGRLSRPTTYRDSPVNTPSEEPLPSRSVPPGAPCPNLAIGGGPSGEAAWLLDHLGGEFVAIVNAGDGKSAARSRLAEIDGGPVPVRALTIGAGGDAAETIADPTGQVTAMLAPEPGSVALIRPDQHVAGRWTRPAAGDVAAAIRRAVGLKAAAEPRWAAQAS